MEADPELPAQIEEVAGTEFAALEVEGSQAIEAAQPLIEQAVTDSEQLAQEAGSAIGEAGNQLLRYIHPNNILPDGTLSSLAFKDATMSVYDEAFGATPEMVLDTMSHGTGQGAVYGLDPNIVQDIPGVTSIESELGTTGNSILDATHQVINNVGTKAVARAIRDVAQYILGAR